MRKPSIFSREYKRRMKERKRKVAIGAVIIVISSMFIMSNRYVKGWFDIGMDATRSSKNDAKSLLTGKSNDKISEEIKTEVEKTENPVVDSKQEEIKVEVEKSFEVLHINNKTIKVIYEENNEGKKLVSAQGWEDFYFDISPDGKKLVVWDKTAQTITLIDSEGTGVDITKPFYKTKNTGTTIKRESQLSKRPEYIWCNTPKFISNESIVYVTNLPLLSRSTQFIWEYDLTKKDHKQIYPKGAKSIVFKDFVEGKLAIEFDSNAKSILPDSKVVD